MEKQVQFMVILKCFLSQQEGRILHDLNVDINTYNGKKNSKISKDLQEEANTVRTFFVRRKERIWMETAGPLETMPQYMGAWMMDDGWAKEEWKPAQASHQVL